MIDERLINPQKANVRRGWRRWLKEPAVAAALTLTLLLGVLLAAPGVRVRLADNLTAAEVFLYGDDVPGSTKPTVGSAGRQSTFKKIVARSFAVRAMRIAR